MPLYWPTSHYVLLVKTHFSFSRMVRLQLAAVKVVLLVLSSFSLFVSSALNHFIQVCLTVLQFGVMLVCFSLFY